MVANVLATAVLDHQAREERQLLLRGLVTAAEQERARVAADLHDGPIQQLSTLSMQLRLIRGRLERREPDLPERESIELLEGRLAAEVRGLRHLMTELRPATLDDHGLIPALRLQAERFRQAHGIACGLELRGMDQGGLPGSARRGPAGPWERLTCLPKRRRLAQCHVDKRPSGRSESALPQLTRSGQSLTTWHCRLAAPHEQGCWCAGRRRRSAAVLTTRHCVRGAPDTRRPPAVACCDRRFGYAAQDRRLRVIPASSG